MGALFKTRMDGVTANSDAAAYNWRQAARAKKRGDLKAMRAYDAAAQECDALATGFAEGAYDDVVADRRGAR